MTTNHTPGPWRALSEECDKPYIRIRGTKLGGRYKVANVLTPVYDGVHQREAEETRANASLIAAAPELLAALEAWQAVCDRIVDQYDGVVAGVDFAALGRANRGAIAKAKGEQQ